MIVDAGWRWSNNTFDWFAEKGRAVANTVTAEVVIMLATVWVVLCSLMYSLQLSTGSFLQPLTAQEEEYYLRRSAQGDLEARNILIERNLRLVAHIMKKYWCARKLSVEKAFSPKSGAENMWWYETTFCKQLRWKPRVVSLTSFALCGILIKD